ncbi:hypothetical protein, partial [Klebsiella pneumoniae]|uniref:hypothetical protein n=1 Tax=Klebsiella pneumoniae TaxID=573 RepID=UPI003016C688
SSQLLTRLAVAPVARSGYLSYLAPGFMPDGGYALPGLQGPLTGSYLAGPRKRSAAGHGEIYFPANGSVSSDARTAA